MDGKLTILGCGSSAGVPAIGNWWGACDPNEPRNRRTRPSIALQTQNTLVIVDTGPDFREQMNRERLGCPDAIIITHVHSDHVNGIDELRMLQRLNKTGKFPTHAMKDTLEQLYKRVDYMFTSKHDGFYPAVCEAIEIDIEGVLTIGDITLKPFEQDHGTTTSLGLRIGNIGYSTDVKRLDEKAFKILRGIDTWIVDANGYKSTENPVHANLDEVMKMNAKIGAKKVMLTHLPPNMDYQTLLKELPENFFPCYDGMTMTFTL